LRIALDVHVVQMNDEIPSPELPFGMTQKVGDDV